MKLVIVESPKKAKTIAGILGRAYRVEASFGHVRDLPPKRLGVSIEEGFAPEWVPVAKARARLGALKKVAAQAEVVLLATDPDREGEAIAWHVADALGLRTPTRVVFHAITPGAIRAAFEQPRQLDRRLVEAQQARRVLDRLVGYQVSPLLWRKIARGTSAGRVQSVALRLIVEREREIQRFVAREYWTIDAVLHPQARPDARFTARLIEIDGGEVSIPDRATTERIVDDLGRATYRIAAQSRKLQQRSPPPPFTTSTLQQAAAARLRLPGKRTMALAQSLYEAGLITYHRTDAVRVEPEAVRAARTLIATRYGAEYLPEKPRYFANRVKNAQEAHEAIRPVDVARLPEDVPGLDAPERALYRLVWQRFVASQMAAARYDRRTVEVAARGEHRYLLRAGATRLLFPGYLAVYGVEAEDTSDTLAGDGAPSPVEADNTELPELRDDERLELIELLPVQRFTQPPARFTEPALVRELERAGVGRPSTYAAIVGTILDRGYVEREKGHFVPTELGVAVNDFVVSFFPTVADLGFTANLEDGLDAVARGERGWQELLGEFYRPFRGALDVAGRAAERPVVVDRAPAKKSTRRVGGTRRTRRPPPDPLTRRVLPRGATRAAPPDPEDPVGTPPSPRGEVCPQCGRAMVQRSGPFGPFLGCSGYPKCRGTINLERPSAPRATKTRAGARSGKLRSRRRSPGR